MDRKSIIILVLCLLVLFSWNWVVNRIYPPIPAPHHLTNAPNATLTGTNPLPPAAQAPAPSAAEAPAPATTAMTLAHPAVPEQTLALTNGLARYTFTSYGGGLQLVELLKFKETVETGRHVPANNNVATLDSDTPAPTLALLDGEAVQGDNLYQLTRTADGVRAEKLLPDGLAVVKDFRLGSNYLVLANVRLENRSDRPLAVPAHEWFVGTATPMNAQDNNAARTVGMMWYNGTKSQDLLGASHFSSSGFMCTPRTAPADYHAGESNVVWVAVHNQFFALVLMPQQAAQRVIMRPVPLTPPSAEEVAGDSRIIKAPQGYTAALEYPGLTLAPHETAQRSMAIYAGPKEYRTLASVAAELNNNVDLVMNFGFWGFFSKALLLSMNALHNHLLLPYGWAIIAITIIIKVVFWPLTQASTRSAKRMQALQPQIKALQEKHKDDPVKSQKKMMEFWKEHKINPMSGCLPTLIQMPVFFGFFFMIGSAIELRGQSWLWVRDLSRPDTLFLIPGLGFPFNLLPLVMGVTMLWQAHLTPPSPGMDPAQAKMMRYMPLIFLVFLYNYSAGLTLYWTVQNLLSIVQTKLTRTRPEPALAGPALTPPPKRRK